MPSEMTLTLKLHGVGQLVNQIKRLNDALDNLNKGFSKSANLVGNAANKISNAVTQMKAMGGIPVAGKGGSGKGQNTFNVGGMNLSQQDIGSIFFSGMAGAWRVLFAKITSRLASQGINTQNMSWVQLAKAGWQALPPLVKLGVGFFLLSKLIGGITNLFEAFGRVLKALVDSIRLYTKFFLAAGGRTNLANQLRSIASSLGLDPNKVAADAQQQGGFGQVLLNKLEILRNIKDPEAASRFAQIHGLGDYWQVRNMSAEEWQKTKTDKPFGGRSDKVPNIVGEIGKLGEAWDNLKASIAPLLDLLAPIIWLIKQVVAGLAWFADAIGWVIQKIKDFLDFINPFGDPFADRDKASDKMKDAAKNFKEGVDKFTDKIGSYGLGPRGQNAIPRAWNWYMYQDDLIRMKDRMGGFEF